MIAEIYVYHEVGILKSNETDYKKAQSLCDIFPHTQI